MTDNELNMKVCEALGWEMVDADTQCPFWRVPSDQPWFCEWDNASICNPPCPDDVPDFLNNPAESERLMVWTKMAVAWNPEHNLWESWPSEGGTVGTHHKEPSAAIVLAFLASKGVEVMGARCK